jgi:hypothetical protein
MVAQAFNRLNGFLDTLEIARVTGLSHGVNEVELSRSVSSSCTAADLMCTQHILVQ